GVRPLLNRFIGSVVPQPRPRELSIKLAYGIGHLGSFPKLANCFRISPSGKKHATEKRVDGNILPIETLGHLELTYGLVGPADAGQEDSIPLVRLGVRG